MLHTFLPKPTGYPPFSPSRYEPLVLTKDIPVAGTKPVQGFAAPDAVQTGLVHAYRDRGYDGVLSLHPADTGLFF